MTALKTALLFEDSRAHFVFTDSTAIILHSKGDCFTYFDKTSAKTRQLVKFAVNSAVRASSQGAFDKLAVALNFFNTYAPIPVFSRDDQLDLEPVQLLQRITTASWPGEENLGDFTWQDADGSLHLKSLDDDFTAVSLDPNGFLVTVQYLYLLPYKVPEWTETSASSSTRSMKMAYTYTKVRSIFSVSAIPLQWQYPVHLLLRIRQTDQTEPLVLVSTQDDASYTELVPNKEYQTTLPQAQISDDERIGVWAADDVSPASVLYCNSNPILLWTSEHTSRINQEFTEVNVHQDQSLMIIKNDTFISHFSQNNTSHCVRQFTVDTVPITICDGRVYCQILLAQTFNMIQNRVKESPQKMIEGLNLQQFYSYSGCDEVHHEMKVEALGTFTAYTNRCVKVRFEDRTVLRMKQGSEHIRILNAKGEEMTINLNGVARSYSLLKDYQNYIKVAREFLDWVYLTKEEKQFVDQIALKDKIAVESEINKIKRSLLVTGMSEEHVECEAYNAITNNKQQIDDIQKLLNSL